MLLRLIKKSLKRFKSKRGNKRISKRRNSKKNKRTKRKFVKKGGVKLRWPRLKPTDKPTVKPIEITRAAQQRMQMSNQKELETKAAAEAAAEAAKKDKNTLITKLRKNLRNNLSYNSKTKTIFEKTYGLNNAMVTKYKLRGLTEPEIRAEIKKVQDILISKGSEQFKNSAKAKLRVKLETNGPEGFATKIHNFMAEHRLIETDPSSRERKIFIYKDLSSTQKQPFIDELKTAGYPNPEAQLNKFIQKAKKSYEQEWATGEF